jgi:hypothetical protein
MDEPLDLLRRQAEWQRKQASLSWAAKIRFAEAVRESIARLRSQTSIAEDRARSRSGSE